MGHTSREQPRSQEGGRREMIPFTCSAVTCSAVSFAAEMSRPAADADAGSLADASISRPPSLTKDQCLSRNLTGLQTGIAEATSLGDLTTTRLSTSSVGTG